MRELMDLEQRVAALEKTARSYEPSPEEYDYVGWTPIKGAEREVYLNEVWDMYVKTYTKIGLILRSPAEMMKYHVWYLYFSKSGQLICFSVFKQTPLGMKAGLTGSNMESDGKAVIKEWISTRWKRVRNFYAEVSHSVEHLSLKAGAPVLCAAYAGAITGDPILAYNADNVHYTRMLGGEPREKILIGNPKGFKSMPFGKAITACPIPSPETMARVARIEKISATEALAEHLSSVFENSLI